MIDREKVRFVKKVGDDKFETESLWCIKDGDYYIVDNIPFIAERISLGDKIRAEYDSDDKAYYFDDFVEISGNTTVRLFFEDESLIPSVREDLRNKYGCESEGLLARNIIAVNIPKDIDYRKVKEYLEDGEKLDKWEYEESCLVHEY